MKTIWHRSMKFLYKERQSMLFKEKLISDHSVHESQRKSLKKFFKRDWWLCIWVKNFYKLTHCGLHWMAKDVNAQSKYSPGSPHASILLRKYFMLKRKKNTKMLIIAYLSPLLTLGSPSPNPYRTIYGSPPSFFLIIILLALFLLLVVSPSSLLCIASLW